MVRKILAIAVSFLLAIPFIPFSSYENKSTTNFSTVTATTEFSRERVKTYENICVDVGTDGDGYYALMSNVEIHYDENDISYFYIDDPTLLAFRVSSEYNGGVWVLDLDEGEKVLNDLREVNEILKKSGNTELSEKLQNSIDILEYSGPFTQAST